MVIKKLCTSLVCAAVVISASGCSKGGDSASEPGKSSASQQPVTLKILQHGATISQDEVKMLLTDPVQKKYPHITLEFFTAPTGYGLEQMVAAGDLPDMIYSADVQLPFFHKLDVPYDLTELVKKYNVDLGKFDQQAIETIKIRSNLGNVLAALPFSLNTGVLYYNKNIFDRFGVPYPKDGMTWEDAVELGKKIGRVENNVTYYGLDNLEISQMSLPVIDYKTNKATFTADGFKRFFTMWKAVKEIPPGNKEVGKARDNFMKNNTLAMLADWFSIVTRAIENKELNWDIASYPVFAERPGIGLRTESHMLVITSASQHKEEAFQAITAILSDENQVRAARMGRLSSLNDPKYKQLFGADVPGLAGKNIKGALSIKSASILPSNKYTDIAGAEIGNIMSAILQGKDVNTALREAEERANQKIATELAANK
ncbi:extracellular solute-binding protein [Paenibacillus allorhizosphaerae]|uniref:Extracellular solute-binding protein n=1 Tax=Paenibacillus allorhizosphaerae TaxID=2849866 RepID=A0ABN7TI39_9BACL|nr:extracellular solute-binding protein [Paenibacillus allorhizosphaerae]CAG7629896.1 hypothetical protein PAECIP111802_01599 [Paenibacillus allorhizosphaerae]